MTRTAQLEQETYLRLLRAEDRLSGRAAALLKPRGLSLPQYNVLRILRGAGPEGLPCQEIRSRMISRVPDITRLLDRLEAAGLVQRERSASDRRVVMTHVSASGRRLLEQLEEPVQRVHEEQFAGMERTDLKRLHDLLGEVLTIRND